MSPLLNLSTSEPVLEPTLEPIPESTIDPIPESSPKSINKPQESHHLLQQVNNTQIVNGTIEDFKSQYFSSSESNPLIPILVIEYLQSIAIHFNTLLTRSCVYELLIHRTASVSICQYYCCILLHLSVYQ